ncbi:MAG: 50S ribosomal protein L1 [Bacilli bacterium]|jgi:large subunit ribosomal protein L1|nr:50S ribosomal protein L1 [Bacilli bacterium]MDD2681697.1 50S ribosomal protein L1 [Bacilli bacterium]MDD3121552.1 50S ribosomal protein L1 [Bacilli bacterium]MDD4062823.1 50S ribosomal protein L1 [Bacilli bacterium]MDD4482222.1 50S ribosomal protein L1 [Bacilli bacterium]
MAKKGRKYAEALKLVDRTKKYNLDEAIELVKKTSYAKFDATVELAFNLNLNPKKAEQNLRGAIVLPHGSGKTRKVLVLAKGAKIKEAEEAGADFFGETDYIEKIQTGWLDFDVIVATPDMMGQLGRLGKLLGPKGLMPNAKTGTVTMDIAKAVSEIKAGKVEYRVDKSGNIQFIVGKTSFDDIKLNENIKTIYDVIIKSKPSTVKGVYIENVSISATMGPGIKINSDSMVATKSVK